MAENKYCTNCGAEIDEKAEICPKCGVRQAEPGAYRETRTNQGGYQQKNPVLALILSLIIVGVGQVYNGQIVKGIIFFLAALILGLTGIGLIISFIIWLYAMYDAYTIAQRINDGEIVGDIGSSR
jgi:TM2 domain-containing membrane protein YozV